MRTARLALAGSLLAATALAAAVAAPGDAAPGSGSRSPEGRWLTEDRRGVIEVEPCGAALCGTIEGISDWPKDGGQVRDITGAPQCHMVLLAALKLRDDGRWHGTVRDPEDGRVYRAEVWVPADGALRLRGYIGLPLFGSTQVWPAFHGVIGPDCHFGHAAPGAP